MENKEAKKILHEIIKCGDCIMVYTYQKPCIIHYDKWYSVTGRDKEGELLK